MSAPLLFAAAILLGGEPNLVQARPAVEYVRYKEGDCLLPHVRAAEAALEDFRAAQRRWLQGQFPDRPVLSWETGTLFRPGPETVRTDTAHVQLRSGASLSVCFETGRQRGWPTSQAEKALADYLGEAFVREHFQFLPGESLADPGAPECTTCPENILHPHFVLRWAFRVAGKPFVDHRVGFIVDPEGKLLSRLENMPDCKTTPTLCEFNVDEAEALRIAREDGFEPGLKPWTAQFHYHTTYGFFVWSVSNFLDLQEGGSESGNMIQIDARTGAILSRGGWFAS